MLKQVAAFVLVLTIGQTGYAQRIRPLPPIKLPMAENVRREAAAPRSFSVVESVFLDTDSVAAKKLGAARDLVAARQWSDAVDLIHQIAEQHGERIVPIEPGRYISVQGYCDILLSSLPPEGLAMYRSRVDPQARRWFEAALPTRDVEGLERVVRRAFLSSYGDDAAWILGELAWEQGEFSRARGFWERLLPLNDDLEPGEIAHVARYPQGAYEPAAVRARLVLASLMQGQLDRAERELEGFARLHPQSAGALAGRNGVLSETLAAVLAEVRRTQLSSEDSEVPTFAGNSQRNKVFPQAVDVGSVQWWVPLDEVKIEVPPQREERQPRWGPWGDVPINRNRTGQPPEVLSCFPAVHGNIVYYCDDSDIYAVNLLSKKGGEPAWGTEASIYHLPAELRRGAVRGTAAKAGITRYTLSIDRGRLYARLGATVAARGRTRAMPGMTSALVCLDLARQGDLAWIVKAEELEGEGGPWMFDGSPVAADGRVYVALRRNDPQLQLNVACFDAGTARLLWNRKVCIGLEALGGDVDEIHHQLLTLAEERIYFCTNLGAVAALESRDGAVRWVATYPRVDVQKIDAFESRQIHGPNPCVFHDGTVFAAPSDADEVLAFDAETGKRKWSSQLARLDSNVHQLLGVAQGRLIAAGNLLWALDVETGESVWTVGQRATDAATSGRGVLAGEYVYWPRKEEILMIDQTTGRILRKVPLREHHHLGGSGGNLTIADGFLLVAQADRLYAFSEYGALRKDAERKLTASPRAARPHIQLALLDEATENLQGAAEHFRAARDLARPGEMFGAAPLAEAAADKLFEAHVAMSVDAASRNKWALAEAQLEEAVRAAPNMARRQQAQLELARRRDAAGKSAAAVALIQKVLDDASAAGAGPGPGVRSGVQQARDEIERLVRRHGREAYVEVERRAERAFSEALEQGDVRPLNAALGRFPNAAGAIGARQRLAALQASAGDVFASNRTYRQLAAEGGAEVQSAAIAGLARNAEERGYWRSAATFWQQLYDEFPKAAVHAGGAGESAREFVPRRLAEIISRDRPAAATPFAGPVIRRWELPLPDRAAAIVPEGDPPSEGLACVLVGGDVVGCVDPRDGRERWQAAFHEPISWAAFVSDLLVTVSSSTVTAFAPESGQIVWQRTFGAPATVTRGAARDHDIYCLVPGRELTVLCADDGAERWVFTPPGGKLLSHFYCGPHNVAMQATGPDRLFVLDADNGAVLVEAPAAGGPWRRDPLPLEGGETLALLSGNDGPPVCLPRREANSIAYRGPLSHVHAAPELISNGKALVALLDGNTLARVDPETGARMWSSRLGNDVLIDAPQSACADEERVYVAAGGILRGFSLGDGRMQWETFLGKSHRTWHVSRAGDWLAARSADEGSQTCVTLCDRQTGALAQRLNFDDARVAMLHAGPHVAVVATDRRVVGLGVLAGEND